MIILQVIFWLCVLMVFHSYVLFPFLLKWLSAHQRKNQSIKNNNTPAVTVIMAAFNEEAVIGQKLESILQSKYPKHLTEILIGSDCSTDNTENIVLQYAQQHPNVYLYPFTERQGKANIINQLVGKAKGDILILSDANVMFASDTISQLIIPFTDNSVGLVDTRMVNTNIKEEGISFQEKSYISREVSIKNREGILWGTMMGPFGGCYAIRRELYRQVPSNLLVDDFYICMAVLEQGYKAVNNLKAIVYEDVSNDLGIEFRRKIRIATGDFQNLMIFSGMLFSTRPGLSFSFWSHKVLRWLGPLFLIGALSTSIALSTQSNFYLLLLGIYSISFLIPIIDMLLKKANIHNKILRFITHFYTMNLALLAGLFIAIKGVKNNVWKPTERFQ